MNASQDIFSCIVNTLGSNEALFLNIVYQSGSNSILIYHIIIINVPFVSDGTFELLYNMKHPYLENMCLENAFKKDILNIKCGKHKDLKYKPGELYMFVFPYELKLLIVRRNHFRKWHKILHANLGITNVAFSVNASSVRMLLTKCIQHVYAFVSWFQYARYYRVRNDIKLTTDFT